MLHFYDNFWNPSLYCLNSIERNGIKFSEEVSVPAAVKAEADSSELNRELQDWTGWHPPLSQSTPHVENWGSTEQFAAFLYDYKNFPIPPVKGTLKAIEGNREKKRTTSEAGVLWLAQNVPNPDDRKFLALRVKYKKALKYGTYLRNLPTYRDTNGRIHTTLGPDTDTGRLSSRNPALQQIPKSDSYGIRSAFVPAEGNCFIVADYSQLEMYVLADLLAREFNDTKLISDLLSGDVHSATAKRTWPWLQSIPNLKLDAKGNKKRDEAKTLNYAVNYGKTAVGLGYQITDEHGVPIGKQAAQNLLDAYFAGYPAIVRYQRWISSYAKKHGGVHTLLGRFRPLPEIGSSSKWEVRAAERKALNTPMQGGAADIVTAAMLRLNVDPLPELIELGWFHRALHATGAFPVLQVHDELVFECPLKTAQEALEIVKYEMENPIRKKMHVKFKVDANISENWAEGK